MGGGERTGLSDVVILVPEGDESLTESDLKWLTDLSLSRSPIPLSTGF